MVICEVYRHIIKKVNVALLSMFVDTLQNPGIYIVSNSAEIVSNKLMRGVKYKFPFVFAGRGFTNRLDLQWQWVT